MFVISAYHRNSHGSTGLTYWPEAETNPSFTYKTICSNCQWHKFCSLAHSIFSYIHVYIKQMGCLSYEVRWLAAHQDYWPYQNKSFTMSLNPCAPQTYTSLEPMGSPGSSSVVWNRADHPNHISHINCKPKAHGVFYQRITIYTIMGAYTVSLPRTISNFKLFDRENEIWLIFTIILGSVVPLLSVGHSTTLTHNPRHLSTKKTPHYSYRDSQYKPAMVVTITVKQ